MQVRPVQESIESDVAGPEIRFFETLIIGTGFSGLLATIGSKKKNLNDFSLLERSAEPGGTWRDNGKISVREYQFHLDGGCVTVWRVRS